MITLFDGNKVSKSDIKKWVAALRSGEFQQTCGRLQNEFGYCCLGVACKIFIPPSQLRFWDAKRKILEGHLPNEQDGSPSWLMSLVQDFSNRTGKGLSGLNDHARFNFDEIADVIEAVYLLNVLDSQTNNAA